MNRKYTALIFRVALLVAVVVFLSIYLQGLDYSQLRNLHFSPLPLLLSAILSMAFRYWGVHIWRGILQDLGCAELPRFQVLAAIYAKSWMARYIPGTLPWIASRVILAQDLGISKSRLSVASLVEAIVQVVAIAATAIVLLSLDDRVDAAIGSELRLLVLFGGISLTVVLVPSVFNRLIKSAYRLIRGQEAYSELATNRKASVRSFVRYAAGSLVSGLSYFFLALAIWPATSPGDLIFVIGAVNLAAVLGMATPFVPSGLGVRDASLLILLAIVFPKEIAIAITVFSRLWSVIIDLVFYSVAGLLSRKR